MILKKKKTPGRIFEQKTFRHLTTAAEKRSGIFSEPECIMLHRGKKYHTCTCSEKKNCLCMKGFKKKSCLY